MKPLITICCLAIGLQAQSTLPISLTLSSDAVAGLQSFAASQTTGATLVLASPILLGDTSITLQNANGITAPAAIRFDSEAMLITAIAGNVATVTRGIFGTAAASHSVIQGDVLRFPNIVILLKALLQRAVSQLLQTNPGPLIAAQQSAIVTAQQQIQLLQSEAVQ